MPRWRPNSLLCYSSSSLTWSSNPFDDNRWLILLIIILYRLIATLDKMLIVMEAIILAINGLELMSLLHLFALGVKLIHVVPLMEKVYHSRSLATLVASANMNGGLLTILCAVDLNDATRLGSILLNGPLLLSA